ncbi:MAG TPA: hemerythrin domain-containing protein [Thermoanaerobaculia bacterium]
MNKRKSVDRRDLLRRLGFTGAALALPVVRSVRRGREEPAEEVTPAEDLMREHGVLNRVLLVYEECLRRLSSKGADFAPRSFADAARIIRSFIEDYHEKLEEDHLFPRFEKAGRHVNLVKTLREQHRAGRRLTDEMLHLATDAGFRNPADRERLRADVTGFIRMYRPHEAREDTVLFPAFRGIVSSHEYASLGEDFEKKEHQLFGKEGFEGIVEKVAAIEKELGIYDLAKFTPAL